MNYRPFQSTKISEIGLGTWQLGGAEWGAVNDEDAFSILQKFIDAGGNFIDSADVYGSGVSERIIGKFLKSISEKIYVATKLGRRSDNGFGWPQNFSFAMMRKQIEDSLENLGLSSLFLEQLHCIPTDELRKGDVFDHLRKFQHEGIIEHWGVSVETSEEALICLEEEGLSSLQVIFNLFRQHVAEEIFSKAKEKGVAIIVRVPLASGLLSGKFNEQTRFPEKDHRSFNANGEAFNVGETFAGIEFQRGVRFAQDIAQQFPDNRIAQWSLRWILDHPEVTTVIPGATKISQVESNVAASSFPHLSNQVHENLRIFYQKEIRPMIRGSY